MMLTNQEILGVYHKFFDIDHLKSNHEMIHYFGLGFIQLKINRFLRMHFYNTSVLPPIVPEEDVHNHRYDFNSVILKGQFNQELFFPIAGADYVMEDESCKEGVETNKAKVECGLIRLAWNRYTAGDEYFIHHHTFHRVKADYCITLLTRSEYKKDLAAVIRPKHSVDKVCPFAKKVPEVNLWEIVRSMLSNS